jgi:epoxyqueuosine reductase
MFYTQFTIEPLRFTVYADNEGVFSLFINSAPRIPKEYIELPADDARFFNIAKQLTEYLKGKRKVFRLKYHYQGTKFQHQVWDALKSIPYGTTISYKTLAMQIGNEKAVRAVGGANKLNPLPIIVPCHRVIQADGSLGGYACGIKVKRLLLEIERGKQ